MDVAALYCLSDSIYHQISGVEVWDAARDARSFPGGVPIVAHPPCAQWGRLRTFAKRNPAERECALLAVQQVRHNGGVLEHPAGSALWKAAGLPGVGHRDAFGGFSLMLSQRWFGHPCEKKTLLYVCGIEPGAVPPLHEAFGGARYVIATNRRGRGARPVLPGSRWNHCRERTPYLFALWLVELARRCKPA